MHELCSEQYVNFHLDYFCTDFEKISAYNYYYRCFHYVPKIIHEQQRV